MTSGLCPRAHPCFCFCQEKAPAGPGRSLCYFPDTVLTPESWPQPHQASQQQLPPQELIFLLSSAELACGLLFPLTPRHTRVLALSIKPVSFFFFIRRKKSIEIDLKMSNLINSQLSQQDRYFIGYCRGLISPRPFSQLHGVTNQPLSILTGPIREGGVVARWLSGSGTGLLLFILFNLGF